MLPIKLSLALGIAAALIAVLHFAHVTIDRRWLVQLGLGILVFAVCQIGFSGLMLRLGLERQSQMDEVLDGLLRERSDLPTVLLVGSSLTSRGLDGGAVEAKLRASGLQKSVRQLTYPGVFAFEQDVALDKYLKAAPQEPSMVLIELGTEYDGAVFKADERFTAGYILQSDPPRAWWGFQVLLDRTDLPLAEWFKAATGRAQSFLGNITGTGFLRQMSHTSRREPIAGYIPMEGRTEGVTDEQIRAGLATPNERALNIEGARGFRLWQRGKLIQSGVKDVYFFVPPVADPVRRVWNVSLCTSLGKLCFHADEPDLMRALPPSYWRDMGHLNVQGAAVYTQWFAARLRDAL